MKIFQAFKAAAFAIKSVYTTTTLHLSSWWQGITAEWSGPSYDRLVRLAYSNPTAARGLRLISQLMASVPYVVEMDDEEHTMEYNHEMLQLLIRPNPRMAIGELMSQIVAHLYCSGDVFFHRNAPGSGPNRGKPTANGGSLRLLNPGKFYDFIRDGQDEVIGYQFYNRRGQVIRYTTDEVLHVRIYDPHPDAERGMPLLLGAARALDQLEAADGWNQSVAKGGGRVPGYFMPKLPDGHQLTPEQVAAAQEQVDDVTRERREKFLPQVLSGAFDFKEGAMSMRDADFLRAGQQNSRLVAVVLGLSPTLLGDEKAGSLTDAGVNSELRAAYILTVLPLIDFILGELNAWLSPAYGGVRLSYDRDQIEALNEDVNSVYDRYRKAAGGAFISVNEAREANGYERLGPEYDEIRSQTRINDAPDRADADPLPGVRAAIRAHYASKTLEN